MLKSLNVIIYVFLLIFLSVTNSYSESAICQSESDCAQVCEEYEQNLNSDEDLPDVYDCSISGFFETGTIQEDGTSESHTEYNCLCVAIGKKGQDDSDDGGDSKKPGPPVILNPLIPDLPPGILPPENGFAECMANAQKREEEMKIKCTNDFKQDWNPDLAEEHRRFFAHGGYLRCINLAEKTASEMRRECHVKWAKKSIDGMTPLQIVD